MASNLANQIMDRTDEEIINRIAAEMMPSYVQRQLRSGIQEVVKLQTLNKQAQGLAVDESAPEGRTTPLDFQIQGVMKIKPLDEFTEPFQEMIEARQRAKWAELQRIRQNESPHLSTAYGRKGTFLRRQGTSSSRRSETNLKVLIQKSNGPENDTNWYEKTPDSPRKRKSLMSPGLVNSVRGLRRTTIV